MFDLKLILESHEKWLNDEEGGVRANLSGADFRGASLYNMLVNTEAFKRMNLRGNKNNSNRLRNIDVKIKL